MFLSKKYFLVCLLAFITIAHNVSAITTFLSLTNDLSDVAEAKNIYLDSFGYTYSLLDLSYNETDEANAFFNTFESFVGYNIPGFDFIVARTVEEGPIVGFAAFVLETAYTVYLERMGVTSALWGQGIGQDLLFSMSTYKPYVNTIILDTHVDNTISQSFFEKNGCVEFDGFKLTDTTYMGYIFSTSTSPEI